MLSPLFGGPQTSTLILGNPHFSIPQNNAKTIPEPSQSTIRRGGSESARRGSDALWRCCWGRQREDYNTLGVINFMTGTSILEISAHIVGVFPKSLSHTVGETEGRAQNPKHTIHHNYRNKTCCLCYPSCNPSCGALISIPSGVPGGPVFKQRSEQGGVVVKTSWACGRALRYSFDFNCEPCSVVLCYCGGISLVSLLWEYHALEPWGSYRLFVPIIRNRNQIKSKLEGIWLSKDSCVIATS